MVDSRCMILSSSGIDTLVRCAVPGVRSILRRPHITNASIRGLSDNFIVHNLEPYENLENIKVFTTVFLVFLVMNLFTQSFVRFDIAILVNVIRLLISALYPPLLVMRDPKQNLVCFVDFLAVWHCPCQVSWTWWNDFRWWPNRRVLSSCLHLLLLRLYHQHAWDYHSSIDVYSSCKVLKGPSHYVFTVGVK